MDQKEKKIIKLNEYESITCLDAATDEDIKALERLVANYVVAVRELDAQNAVLRTRLEFCRSEVRGFINKNLGKFKLENNKQDNK